MHIANYIPILCISRHQLHFVLQVWTTSDTKYCIAFLKTSLILLYGEYGVFIMRGNCVAVYHGVQRLITSEGAKRRI